MFLAANKHIAAHSQQKNTACPRGCPHKPLFCTWGVHEKSGAGGKNKGSARNIKRDKQNGKLRQEGFKTLHKNGKN